MVTSMYKFIVVLSALTLMGLESYAFPTMVKHGYTTCMTCHYSPSGAGALTNYGKFIAGELFGRYNDSSDALPWLRTPTTDDKFEKKFFSSNIDWILGHQARVTQSYWDKPTVKYGNPHLMQFDIEAGLGLNQFFAVMQVGFLGAYGTFIGKNASDLEVRQYYAGARDINYAFRVGKFFPEFGIRHPNHNLPTRKGLFFNHNEEPNLAQLSYFFLNADLNIGYLEGVRGALKDLKGTVATVTVRTDHTRSGISHIKASKDSKSEEATSVFTAVGYEEKGYTLAEYALRTTKNGSIRTNKQVAFVETGWEITKGLIPYLGYQRTKLDGVKYATEYMPVGIKFYPYTHLEMNAEFGKLFLDEGGTKGNGYAGFAMVHWYF